MPKFVNDGEAAILAGTVFIEMGFFSTVFGFLGFGIGLPLGLLAGFFIFVYSVPKDVKEPDTRPLLELDTTTLQDLMPEIPLWVKSPDYDRVDWLNKFLLAMWPYLDKNT